MILLLVAISVLGVTAFLIFSIIGAMSIHDRWKKYIKGKRK